MKNKTNIILGVALIIAGFAFLFGLGFLWPLLLVGVGLMFLIMRHFTISFVLITVGSMLLASELTDYDVFGRFWPLIIIAIGLSIIASSFINPRSGGGCFMGFRGRKSDGNKSGAAEDKISMEAILSDSEHSSSSKNFKGGEMNVILGSGRLDLRGAELAESGAEIEANAILGELEIIVPTGVKVVTNGSPILGDWKNKIRNNTGSPANAPTITINGSAILGSVVIRD